MNNQIRPSLRAGGRIWSKLSLLLALSLVPLSVSGEEADLSLVLARIGDEEITLGDALALKDTLPDELRMSDATTLMPQIIDQIATQIMMARKVEDSDKLEYMVEAAERSAKVGLAFEDHIEKSLTEDYLKATYDRLIGEVEPGNEYNASHILLDSEEDAKKAIERIKGGEEFGVLAAELSSDGSSQNKGSLGWFGEGDMVPEFEKAVMALEKGGLSAPVQSQFGWHVIKLNDIREAEAPSFEDVKDDLKAFAQSQLAQELVEEAKQSAEVEIIEGIDPELINSEF